MDVILTVAESKRLIAKGIAAHPAVRAAMEKGRVVVAAMVPGSLERTDT